MDIENIPPRYRVGDKNQVHWPAVDADLRAVAELIGHDTGVGSPSLSYDDASTAKKAGDIEVRGFWFDGWANGPLFVGPANWANEWSNDFEEPAPEVAPPGSGCIVVPGLDEVSDELQALELILGHLMGARGDAALAYWFPDGKGIRSRPEHDVKVGYSVEVKVDDYVEALRRTAKDLEQAVELPAAEPSTWVTTRAVYLGAMLFLTGLSVGILADAFIDALRGSM